jgi:hypothetical protein
MLSIHLKKLEEDPSTWEAEEEDHEFEANLDYCVIPCLE